MNHLLGDGKMKHRQGSFFNFFTMKTTTEKIQNQLKKDKNIESIQWKHFLGGLISWDYPFKLSHIKMKNQHGSFYTFLNHENDHRKQKYLVYLSL